MSKDLHLQEQEMNALPQISINLENCTKSDLQTIADNIYSPVVNGEVDSLKQLINIKKLLYILEEVEPKVRALAEENTQLARGEKLTNYSAEVTEKDNARYDYKVCNDPTLNKAQQTVKDRQAFLKTLKEKIILVDEETGETTEIQPPIRSGKLGLNISLK